MLHAPPPQTERERLLHEMSTLLTRLDADAYTIDPFVSRDGAVILDSMKEASAKLIDLFRKLRYA